MAKSFSFTGEVWVYPGVGGWHFVNVPDLISQKIRSKIGKGMVKIEAGISKTKWKTALFPYKNSKGEFGYLISIKNIVRKKENILLGDKVKVTFKLI